MWESIKRFFQGFFLWSPPIIGIVIAMGLVFGWFDLAAIFTWIATAFTTFFFWVIVIALAIIVLLVFFPGLIAFLLVAIGLAIVVVLLAVIL